MPSPTHEDRVYTALFLLSVALRPLDDEEAPDSLRLDRADLWRLAQTDASPVGRNKFHGITGALAAELAADTDEDDDDLLVSVRARSGNRWTVQICPFDDNPWGWGDLLESLGVAADLDTRTAIRDAAIEAAAALGIDTTTALPAETLQAAPADDDGWDDDAEDLSVKACTKCKEEKPADDFSIRTNGRLSSWCRACNNAATTSWREKNRPADAPRLPAPVNRRTTEITRKSGEKVCTGCRRLKPLPHFHYDASRRDGHAVRCKICRREEAYQVSLRRYTDF